VAGEQSGENRDFRLATLALIMRVATLRPGGRRVHGAWSHNRIQGWTATYFVRDDLSERGKYPFKFTTAVAAHPDTDPFPAINPSGAGEVAYDGLRWRPRVLRSFRTHRGDFQQTFPEPLQTEAVLSQLSSRPSGE